MPTTIDHRATELDPHTLAFLQTIDSQGGSPPYRLTPADARAALVRTQRGTPVSPLPVDRTDRTIPGGVTGEIGLRFIRPRAAPEVLPAIIYLHGGGWVLGDRETHDHLMSTLAIGAQATVVYVDYTRAPEAKYPVAIEQAYTATKWVADQGVLVGVNAAQMALAGDSAGGNLAAALLLLIKERGGPKVAAQVLFYPVTNAHLDTHSYQQYGDGGYWLKREAMRWFWECYAPAATHARPTVSPLQTPLDQLRGLPPTLIVTAEQDVLRDEGEAYAHKLMSAGVTVTASRQLGTIHDFVMLNALAETPAARAALAQAVTTLRAAFSR